MKNLKGLGFFILMFSCNTIKKLEGTSYKYESKKRTLELSFESDSICKIENFFHCNDIIPSIRKKIIICYYQRKGDTIYLKNIDCESDTCKKELTISIPPQESKKCVFLNKNSRQNHITFGPNYATDYEKYGLVPNIDIDTLYIIKNRIMLYKKDSIGNVGFIFK